MKKVKVSTKNLKQKVNVLKVVEQSEAATVGGGSLPGDMVGV